jgi:hypothetical protein
MIKLRLSVKLLLFVSLLITGFSMILTWFFLSQSKHLLQEELQRKAFAVASNTVFAGRKYMEQANIFKNLDPLPEKNSLEATKAIQKIGCDKKHASIIFYKDKRSTLANGSNLLAQIHPALYPPTKGGGNK